MVEDGEGLVRSEAEVEVGLAVEEGMEEEGSKQSGFDGGLRKGSWRTLVLTVANSIPFGQRDVAIRFVRYQSVGRRSS